MKVQYLKNHTDEYGMTYLKGWTAEHDEPTSRARIAAGLCVEVDKDLFARRQTVVVDVCGKK